MDGRRAGQVVISLAVIAIGFAMTANGSDFAPVEPVAPITRVAPQPEAPQPGSQAETQAETQSLIPNPAEYKPEFPEAPSLGSVFMRLAGGILFVTIMCGGTVWFGRRWMKQHGLPGLRDGEEMRVLESTRLGGQCTVHLLQIGGQRVLAGTDRSGLHSIVPLPEPFNNVLDDQFAEPASTAAPASEPETPTKSAPGPRIVRSRRPLVTSDSNAAAG